MLKDRFGGLYSILPRRDAMFLQDIFDDDPFAEPGMNIPQVHEKSKTQLLKLVKYYIKEYHRQVEGISRSILRESDHKEFYSRQLPKDKTKLIRLQEIERKLEK